MKLTNSLGRGLAAVATIGAIGLGSILAAAPAGAADHGVIPTEPGASFTMRSWFEIDASTAFHADNTRVVLRSLDGATFNTATDLSGYVIYADGSEGTDDNFRARDCVLSEGDTVKTCTINGAKSPGSQFDYVAGNTYRYGAAVTIPADAQPGQIFRFQGTLSPSTVNMTSTIAYQIPRDAADLVVTSPAAGSVIDATGTVFDGTAEPGETVVLTDADGNVIGQGVADAQGNWSATVTGSLAEGPHTLTFTAGDQVVTGDYVVVIEDESQGVPVMSMAAGLGALALAGVGAFSIRRRADQA